MYRQIKTNATDGQYQHIVWRNSPSENLRDYELLRLLMELRLHRFTL